MNWTPEQTERLKGLWASGMSARECAELLGVTRNAVIGRVNRIGMPPRERKTTIKSTAALKPARRHPFASTAPIKALPPLATGPVEPLNIAFLELGPGQCRFAYGEHAPFTFCGQPQRDESSYCTAHHRLCYAPRERLTKEQRQARKFRSPFRTAA
jgi:GcrA cell cycle regulator